MKSLLKNLFFFLPALFWLTACRSQPIQDQVCFHHHCVKVEIADTEAKRQRGLQARAFLGANEGMLFIFPDSRPYSFWMKETLIPLDIIWLDESRRIVYIEKNAQPCTQDPCLSYTPLAKAMYVLELNGGQSQQLGIKVGDTLQFRLSQYLSKISAHN